MSTTESFSTTEECTTQSIVCTSEIKKKMVPLMKPKLKITPMTITQFVFKITGPNKIAYEVLSHDSKIYRHAMLGACTLHRSQDTPSRTSDANLDGVFDENTLAFTDRHNNLGSRPLILTFDL